MPKTIYKSRDQIDDKYKWDLEFLLENKTLDQNLEILFKKIKELFSWKEKKYNNLENFVAYLKLQDQTTILINKISNYLSNKLNEDVTNTYYNKKSEELSYQLYLLEQEQGAENYLFFKNANKIEYWL
ncbi:MAG: hypothetical protein E7Y34_01560, partial [Mycoplasma sp.]|nr:hypothetical protein [Mycoplasma sp.]